MRVEDRTGWKIVEFYPVFSPGKFCFDGNFFISDEMSGAKTLISVG